MFTHWVAYILVAILKAFFSFNHIVSGGGDSSYQSQDTILEFLPGQQTMKTVGNMVRARQHHAVSAVDGMDHLCT